MTHLFTAFTHWTLHLIALLKPWGVWGAGLISVMDSSSVPVPMELVLASYYLANPRHAWAYVLVSAAGSALGGLLPFLIGRAGGELFLLKRIDRARYEQLRNRFENQEFLALLIPSALPPPTPWKLFAFSGGVFEVRTLTFLLAVFAGRLIRFGVGAFLTIRYGPRFVSELTQLFHRHAHLVLTLLGLFLLAIALWTIRKSAGKRRAGAPTRPGGFGS